MTVTIVETRTRARGITGGVDTHADAHVAAAPGPGRRAARGRRVPGDRGWLCPAAGLAGRVRHGVPGRGRGDRQLWRGPGPAPGGGGVRVVEVDRSDRQDRRRAGKSDPLDAVSAARAALSGRAAGAPKGRDGPVEAIRALMVAKRSARSERTQTINQARALVLTGPDDLRARFARHNPADLVAELAALRPRPGSMVRCHTLLSLRELGRRAQFPGAQLERLDAFICGKAARMPSLRAGRRHRVMKTASSV